MRAVKAAIVGAFGGMMVALLIAATNGASYSGGHSTPEDLVPIRIVGNQVQPNYATIHAPDKGKLIRLTFDVTAAGTGAGSLRIGIVHNLSDGGVDDLCDVNIPCTTASGTHIHPDAGSCNDVELEEGVHYKVSPITSTCNNYPDGILMGEFLWQ